MYIRVSAISLNRVFVKYNSAACRTVFIQWMSEWLLCLLFSAAEKSIEDIFIWHCLFTVFLNNTVGMYSLD